jgi:hypothetical protein
MRFRKLRIAWSVGCALACVLLITLWVRSYWRADSLVLSISKTYQIEMQSVPGRCIAFVAYAPSLDDVEIRYAQAQAAVAKAKYEKLVETNKQAVKSVPEVELNEAKLEWDHFKLAIEKSIHDKELAPINGFARHSSAPPEGAAHTFQRHGVLGGDWPMQTAWVAHWLVVSLCALLGIAPWVRRLRFSLRTLLIGMTLLAVVLGFTVYASR